jgi:hypothetical protein
MNYNLELLRLISLFVTFSERAGLSSNIIEISITSFQSQKLIGYDTLEGWAYQGTFKFIF